MVSSSRGSMRIGAAYMVSKTLCIHSALPPEQIAWCGIDAVLLYWDDMLLMMGDPIRYLYDEPIILIPESDGVRILSQH
ncbi:hypothetical protein L6164_029316 [Bauhinia variegata]|uniref:Uncharacterized protein n=1 Tax=Bauhinia variegata TaxID=167791 RepID=A0ACB9L9C7_BAUVA|nr:hypothetical protein L6164_029316 [Bauhinia variegata]